MFRPVFIAIALVVGVTAPALADGASDAREACAKELKRTYGIPPATTAKFNVGGSGERFSVSGNAPYQGEGSVRVTCKTNGGRVTSVVWG